MKAEALSAKPKTPSVKAAQRRWFPAGLAEKLIAELKALNARASQPEMEALVFRLCAWRPLSTEELAHSLTRSRKYIAARLVTPMFRAGRLEMTLPDQPRHPQQTYRAVETPAEGGPQ